MRGERGSATLIAAVGVLVLAFLMVLLVMVGSAAAQGEAVRGAADLAALAGAEAQAGNQDACAAARRSARANEVTVNGCEVAGDEVEYVVSVTVARVVHFGPVELPLEARAHAGEVTGAPE